MYLTHSTTSQTFSVTLDQPEIAFEIFSEGYSTEISDGSDGAIRSPGDVVKKWWPASFFNKKLGPNRLFFRLSKQIQRKKIPVHDEHSLQIHLSQFLTEFDE